MMIWRLHDWDPGSCDDTSQGYYYFHTRREAEREAERLIEQGRNLDLGNLAVLEGREVKQGKDALIKILQLWGSHNDNG